MKISVTEILLKYKFQYTKTWIHVYIIYVRGSESN